MTASYSLFIKRAAEKELRGLPKADLYKVIPRIHELVTDPRPPSCQKLSGHNQYRIRQGDYRIPYTIDDSNRKIEVIRIGHRREVDR